jgi:YHS domain-containing protein
MKKLIRGIFLGIILIAGLMPSVFAADHKPDGMCPVMPGQKAKEKFFVDYKGKRIYLCCRNCVKAFNKHPERYLKG